MNKKNIQNRRKNENVCNNSSSNGSICYQEFNQHDIAVYAGYIDNDSKILQSTSGGIATALSESMLKQGGLVIGVSYSEDFYKAEYTIIDDIENLYRLNGSKYIDCDKQNILLKTRTLIEQGNKVLFFGLPCMISALYKLLGERSENLITCELVCHGPTFEKVHVQYLEFLEQKYKSKITFFSVRYKNGKWIPGYLFAKFANGKVFMKPFYETEYGIAFSILGKTPCYNCNFKGNNREADIMIGDFWGAEETDEFWNQLGVSVIFSETEKGDAFLKSTSGIKLFETSFERAVKQNPTVIRSKSKNIYYDKFEKLFNKKGLIYAARHYQGWKGFLKKLIPNNLKNFIKNIFKKFKK